MFVQQAKAFEAFEHVEAIPFEVHGCRKISKEGWQTVSWGNIKRFKYKFVTQEYAEKNAIKSPWGDILYRGLPPKNRAEAITQGFYP